MRKSFYAILVAIIVLTTVSSCKKDKKNTSTLTPPAGALQLWSNVHVIDSTQWILFANGIHPENGTYMFTFTPNTPNINVKVGDVIVGSANGGYIRRISSISIAGSYYILQTGQATMADVFKTGSFNFQIPINEPGQGNPGFARTFSNYRVFHNPNFSVTLLNSQFNVQPICDFTFSFDSAAGLTNFQMSTTNATASDNVTFSLKGLVPYTWASDTTLATFTANSIQMVQAWTPAGNVSVPVVVKLGTSYIAKTSGGGSHSDSINTTLNWTTSNVFSGGLQYTGGQWLPLHSSVATNFVTFDTVYTAYHTSSNLTFLTQISSWLYGISGPQITTGLSGSFLELQQGTTSPFHHRTDAWSVATDAQSSSPVIGPNIGPFNQSWSSDSVFYQAPYLLTKISGDGQTGLVVRPLAEPLVVKITDSNGQPASNVKVTFTVGSGGTLSAYTLLTDQTGLAQVTWTLGPPQIDQTVTVTAYDGFVHPLNGAPATFIAHGQ